MLDQIEPIRRLKSNLAYALCAGSAVLGIGLLALVVGYLLKIGLFNEHRHVRFAEQLGPEHVTYDINKGKDGVEVIRSSTWAPDANRPPQSVTLRAASEEQLFSEHPEIEPVWRRAIRPRSDLFTKDPVYFGQMGFPGGMRNGLVGTGILILMATAVGIPLGVLAGVFLAEYDAGSWLAKPVRFICDVLAGVPSIVVGVLGYELLVVPLGNSNGYAGAVALAFIMVPIVARTTEEMLRLVPNSYREASLALGATKARTILRVVLPAATGSVVTGIMLAIARIAGETAPLLFTAGESSYLAGDPAHPFPSLTVMIYKATQRPYPEDHRMAQFGILVLIGLIFVLNLTIRYFANRVRKLA